MIQMNQKTNNELFKAIMNYYIHNDYNFMITRDGTYNTIINQTDIVFKINNTIIDKPKLEIAIIAEKDDIREMWSINLFELSFIDIINDIDQILKTVLLK